MMDDTRKRHRKIVLKNRHDVIKSWRKINRLCKARLLTHTTDVRLTRKHKMFEVDRDYLKVPSFLEQCISATFWWSRRSLFAWLCSPLPACTTVVGKSSLQASKQISKDNRHSTATKCYQPLSVVGRHCCYSAGKSFCLFETRTENIY